MISISYQQFIIISSFFGLKDVYSLAIANTTTGGNNATRGGKEEVRWK
jgi:hypothetical protein